MVLTLADMEGNETFDPAALGTADEVAEIRVADDAMVSHLYQTNNSSSNNYGSSSRRMPTPQTLFLWFCRSHSHSHHLAHFYTQHMTHTPNTRTSQIKISGTKTSQAVTLLLRGANDMHLDEMDRSLHDALCVVKRVLESGAVVPGNREGGGVVWFGGGVGSCVCLGQCVSCHLLLLLVLL